MNELDVKTFEHDWQEKTTHSRNKSREWIFQHAKDMYNFREACQAQRDQLPVSSAKYYEAKSSEWHKYTSDSSRAWARVGGFLEDIQAGRKLVRSRTHDFPASKMTLIEFARLSDAELKKAEDAELITPETTRQDIQDFRELLRMEAAEHAAEAKKAQEEQDKKIEEEVLRWRYDKTVPEELIDILEDTDDASLGIKTADGQEWACVRVNMLWTATKIKKEAPKQEKPKREGDTTDYVALRREQYKLFGIDFNIGSVTEETMSWILTGYRKAHHPDKGEQNAKLTQEAVHIVRAMFPESKRNW